MFRHFMFPVRIKNQLKVCSILCVTIYRTNWRTRRDEGKRRPCKRRQKGKGGKTKTKKTKNNEEGKRNRSGGRESQGGQKKKTIGVTKKHNLVQLLIIKIITISFELPCRSVAFTTVVLRNMKQYSIYYWYWCIPCGPPSHLWYDITVQDVPALHKTVKNMFTVNRAGNKIYLR